MKLKFIIIMFLLIIHANFAQAEEDQKQVSTEVTDQIASCGPSEGFSYYVFQEGSKDKELGWKEDKLSNYLSFIRFRETGNLDILHGSSKYGFASTIDTGGEFKSATLADNAATIVIVYPNKSVETYIFQRLENGEDQLLWTQTVAEKPFRKIATWVAPCEFINLKALF